MRRARLRKTQVMVARALLDACVRTNLTMCVPDGLTGGPVVGDEVEAYVVTSGEGGYQVEMWTHTGDDAYSIVRFTRLRDAVRCAIDAAEGGPPLQ